MRVQGAGDLAQVIRAARRKRAMSQAELAVAVLEFASPLPQRLAELVADRCHALAQRLT